MHDAGALCDVTREKNSCIQVQIAFIYHFQKCTKNSSITFKVILQTKSSKPTNETKTQLSFLLEIIKIKNKILHAASYFKEFFCKPIITNFNCHISTNKTISNCEIPVNITHNKTKYFQKLSTYENIILICICLISCTKTGTEMQFQDLEDKQTRCCY